MQPALALLKDGRLADFRIEVSSDSLVQIDEDREKEQATEFVTAVSQFLGNAAKVPPEVIPLMGEMLKWAAARYRAGKTLEGEIDKFVDQSKQAAAQPKPPSPEEIKAQAEQQKMQFEGQKMQQEAAQQAHENQRAQMEAQMEAMRMQLENQAMQAEQQREAARLELERMQLAMEQRNADLDRQLQLVLERMRIGADIQKQQMQEESAIEQAELSSETTLQAAQQKAAQKAGSNA